MPESLVIIAQKIRDGSYTSDTLDLTNRKMLMLTGLSDIKDALETKPHIKNINLSGSHVTEKHIPTLCALITSCKIETLNLSNCEIDAKTALALAKGIMCNSTLKKLDLSYNNIASTSDTAFLNKFLNQAGSLERLDLGHNKLNLAEANPLNTHKTLEKHAHIIHLSLESNGISEEMESVIDSALRSNSHYFKTVVLETKSYKKASTESATPLTEDQIAFSATKAVLTAEELDIFFGETASMGEGPGMEQLD